MLGIWDIFNKHSFILFIDWPTNLRQERKAEKCITPQ